MYRRLITSLPRRRKTAKKVAAPVKRAAKKATAPAKKAAKKTTSTKKRKEGDE